MKVQGDFSKIVTYQYPVLFYIVTMATYLNALHFIRNYIYISLGDISLVKGSVGINYPFGLIGYYMYWRLNQDRPGPEVS
ncbi:hypothetical protein ACF0H5_011939 [Mactra antiquata]